MERLAKDCRGRIGFSHVRGRQRDGEGSSRGHCGDAKDRAVVSTSNPDPIADIKLAVKPFRRCKGVEAGSDSDGPAIGSGDSVFGGIGHHGHISNSRKGLNRSFHFTDTGTGRQRDLVVAVGVGRAGCIIIGPKGYIKGST